jgi:hypothetical protein
MVLELHNRFSLTVSLCMFQFVSVDVSFVAVVTGDTSDEVYAAMKDVIFEQAGPVVWIPSSDLL